MNSVNPIANLLRRLAGGLVVTTVAMLAAAMLWTSAPHAAEPAVEVPAPAFDPPSAAASETAVLAGGCFWGVQAVFQHVKGVTKVIAGYSGGKTVNPTYEKVSSETTGHAESVEITYDPSQVSYGTLLRVFFSIAHNPTQLNYQGPDHGTSYRSNVFYKSDAQKKVAEAYIAQLTKAGSFSKPIVTRVDPFKAFYRAEDYHQNYLILHPNQPYIVINDAPKLVNFKQLLPELYREEPVTAVAGG